MDSGIIGVLGTVLGVLIGGPITYYYAKILIQETHKSSLDIMQRQEFNKAAATFRIAFVEVVRLFRQENSIKDMTVNQIITDTVLVEQEKAKILFEPYLRNSELTSFNKAWEEYIECRINYGEINKNPTRQEERAYCLKHIRNLLYYAKQK